MVKTTITLKIKNKTVQKIQFPTKKLATEFIKEATTPFKTLCTTTKKKEVKKQWTTEKHSNTS